MRSDYVVTKNDRVDNLQPANRHDISSSADVGRNFAGDVAGIQYTRCDRESTETRGENILRRNGVGVARFVSVEYVVIGIVAVALRLPHLFDSLWYDEAFTAWLARLTFPQMIAATAGDVHPPLWYVIEWLLTHITGTQPEWLLRLPSLVFSVLAIFAADRVFRALTAPDFVRRIAVVLMTVSPFLLHYADEARSYSLLLLIVLLATLAVLRGKWLAFGVLVAIGMYTHNLFALYAVALAIVFLLRRHNVRDAHKSTVLALVLYLPWLPVAARQLFGVARGFWIQPTTPGRVVYVLYQTLTSSAIEQTTMPVIGILVILTLAGGLHELYRIVSMRSVAANGVWYVWSQRAEEILTLAVWPWIAIVAFSAVVKPILIPRVMIGTVPFLFLVMAFGVRKFYNFGGLWTLFPHMVTIVLLIASFFMQPGRVDYRTRYAELPVQAGDVCYHTNVSSIVLAGYYLPQCENILFPHANNLSQSLTDDTKTAMQIHQQNIDDLVTNRAVANTAGVTNVYVFHTDDPFAAPLELDEFERLQQAYDLQNVQTEKIQLFEDSVWRVSHLQN